jgi:hypothetical protein
MTKIENLELIASKKDVESIYKHYQDFENKIIVFSYFDLKLSFALVEIKNEVGIILEHRQFKKNTTIKEVEEFFNDIIDNFYFNILV